MPKAVLLQWLETLRWLYNAALAERKTAWKEAHRNLSYRDQSTGKSTKPMESLQPVMERWLYRSLERSL
ncbi:MAG: helix-turn-helix domain-containing protein [Anaerolineae bacterium]